MMSTPVANTGSPIARTILTMESTGTCLHPHHLHSFQHARFTFSNCIACDKRISLVNDPAVKCIACGVVAHRTCATSNQTKWACRCIVNEKRYSDSQIMDELAKENVCSSSNKEKGSSETIKVDHSRQETEPKERDEISDCVNAYTNCENDSSSFTSKETTRPLHFAHHSFPKVARALQENLIASFKRDSSRRKELGNGITRRPSSGYPGNQQKKLDVDNVLINVATRKVDNPLNRLTDHLDAVKGSVNAATVAGGIAGGVAGLVLAGPAGAYAGYVAAGSLMAESATAVGFVAVGVATGGITGRQIQDVIVEKRTLAMGEKEASRKVLLVRPNIKMDRVWDLICIEAIESAPKQRRKKGNRLDFDIVSTSEGEIATVDKVLLLVSRTLNDKNSVPGHVYRYLVEAFLDRCRTRQKLCENNESISAMSPRARRDDAHAVIKLVTATLLDERPEFGSATALTELTATAVEGLVFGQLYDSVFAEISDETMERDVDLWRKVTCFEKEHEDMMEHIQNVVSKEAIGALQMLPTARSAADKLHFCVRFLDLIAEDFSTKTGEGACADCLLTMACQHIVAIENRESCHAQVKFLEEFARDEQLLKGRDGYALVTLQACMHFLHESKDLYDIFCEGNDSTQDYESAASSTEVLLVKDPVDLKAEHSALSLS